MSHGDTPPCQSCDSRSTPEPAAPGPAGPWPHAPPHWLHSPGTYFVTAGTFQKQRLFDSARKLDLLTGRLIDMARTHGWALRAWAVLVNHYHLVAESPAASGETLRDWLTELHRETATALNKLDGAPGRRVWHNFRETQLTHQTSYLARLRYTHENAVHHGLVPVARDYRWCSAAWFETHAPASFVASVGRFKTDKLNVYDDYEV